MKRKSVAHRLFGAIACLILGVALAIDPMWYWQVAGFLALTFAPALISDAAVAAIRNEAVGR